MKYATQKRPGMRVMGITRMIDPAHVSEQVSGLWNEFRAGNIYDKIPNKASLEVVALYCDYVSDHTQPYRLIIGCVVKEGTAAPVGLHVKELPASDYAVFRPVGEFPACVVDVWKFIWQTPFERTFTGDFEVYGADPRDIKIYLAIRDS